MFSGTGVHRQAKSNRGRQADVLMRYTTFNAQVPTAHFALTFFEAKLKIHVSEWKSALEILSYTLWAAFLHIVFTFPEITQEKNTKTKQSVLQWVGEPHTQCMVSGSACNCPLYFCIYPPTCNHLWGGNKANAEVPNTQVTELGLSTVFVFLTNNMAQCIQEVNIGIFFLLLPDTNDQIFVSLRFQN